MSGLPALTPIINGTPADASEVDGNFDTLATFVDAELINRDGSVAMTEELTLSSSTPSGDLVAASKGYVDGTGGTLDDGNIVYKKDSQGWVTIWFNITVGTTITIPEGFRPVGKIAYGVASIPASFDETIGVRVITAGGLQRQISDGSGWTATLLPGLAGHMVYKV